ncbi:MAG TPA: zinc dependent phospholipase C family protein, partial [Hyphomonas sp.]|nr:zinc dependent phospholipase C family protein [Hyphomonas sp.]
MTLLERVIRNHRCRSTHHYIAFDALSLIGGEEGEAWKSLFLVHHEHLLEGAKAPDAKFKDFKNHVLHVGEGEWGGARAAATEWYARAVDLLRRKRWSEAAYALGVLSHYYADPIQPFHTGQTEAEGIIHRAVEWSIAKSRPEIDARIEANGYPEIEIPDGLGFVSEMVREGALLSHAHYFTFIDHYDL